MSIVGAVVIMAGAVRDTIMISFNVCRPYKGTSCRIITYWRGSQALEEQTYPAFPSLLPTAVNLMHSGILTS